MRGYGEYFATPMGEYFSSGVSGLGSAMQRGQGRDYRDGSLGATLNLTSNNLIFLALGGIGMAIAIKKGLIKPK